MDQPINLSDLGLDETSVAALDVDHAARIAACLDAPSRPGIGDALPTLWHWCFFNSTAPSAVLGPDGHPGLGSERMASYPRRMWGAGRVEWMSDLRVGDPARRTTRVLNTKETTGQSGSLLIVTLEHRYEQYGVDCIREEQSLVYRTPGDPMPLPRDGDPVVTPEGGWSETIIPGPPLLFRYSAVTFNSHRIHYDLPYAHDLEGYPGLVVHGPLTSTLLAAFVERSTGHRLARWEFKASAPMFAGLRATFVCDPVPATTAAGTARVVRNDATVAMRADFGLRA